MAGSLQSLTSRTSLSWTSLGVLSPFHWKTTTAIEASILFAQTSFQTFIRIAVIKGLRIVPVTVKA